ncbi:MAG: hypothetical protein JSR21_22050, partial [Proteobacteria bacterium]|nr:hypothetical protein [Pseudomonadota bacterium]
MAGSVRRRNGGNGLEAWPGYVDALSTLLMVIIFVLLVFVLAQAFLSVALSGRDKALDQVKRQLAEMTDMLSLERGKTKDLQLSVAGLNKSLSDANAARDSLGKQINALTAQLDAANARAGQLQSQLQDQTSRADAATKQAAQTAADLAATKQQLADMQLQAQALDKTVQADKATIEAKLSELAKLAEQVRALSALRDDLQKQVADAAARATTEEQRRQAVASLLDEQNKLADSAKAQIALLNQQVDQLRAQLAAVAKALSISEAAGRDKDAQITNLGQKLN